MGPSPSKGGKAATKMGMGVLIESKPGADLGDF